MGFDLNSRSLASYHWGTLLLRFSPTVPVQKDAFYKILGSLTAGRANWNSADDFRSYAAFLHESVHLIQDLTTGLGHADHLLYNKEMPDLLTAASSVANLSGQPRRPPYLEPGTSPATEKARDALFDRLRERRMYSPFASVFPARLARIRKLIEKELQRPVDNDACRDFSTQTILESDAAMNVARTLSGLDMSKGERELLQQNRVFVDREALGSEYHSAAWHLQQVLVRHCAEDEQQVGKVLPRVFGLFVDSALAFPPHDWIEERGESPDQYEPAVKYLRLLVAFQKIVGQDLERFWLAIVHNNTAEAEAILLGQTSYSYPLSDEIYEAWLNALEPLARSSMVAQIRSNACRWRLDHGVLLTRHNIGLLLEMQVPVIYLQKDPGFVKHDWGGRIVDMEKNFDVTSELLLRFTFMELADFLWETGEFRCPCAQANTCSVAEDECISGIVNVVQFPESSRCLAREILKRYKVISAISGLRR